MSRACALASILLLTGCAVHPQMGRTAIGARDATGARTGDYRIVTRTGSTLAIGRFAHGRMEGRWSFFESSGERMADLTYHEGKASGPYRTYFGGFMNPAVKGKLDSTGQLRDGRVVGRHIARDGRGKVWTDAVVENGRASHVRAGKPEEATRTAEFDEGLVQTLEEAIGPTLR